MFDLNPIDVLKERELTTLPPHFSKIKITEEEFFGGEIYHWVKSKLKGRFSIARCPEIDSNGKLQSSTFIAFEDHKELTYFMLACPYLRRN